MTSNGKCWTRRSLLLLGVLPLAALLAGTLVRAGSGSGSAKVMSRLVSEAIGMYDTDGDRALCLSNVKLISGAFKLYLDDNDGRLPPAEDEDSLGECQMMTEANPYLRWPVVLDQYVHTRSAWDCPSARVGSGAQWIVGYLDWQRDLKKNEERQQKAKVGDESPGLCAGAWPAGWGGSVTDSAKQKKMAIPGDPPRGTGAFRQSIGCSASYGLNRAGVSDPAWYVVCGDSTTGTIFTPVALAYANVCKAGKGPGESADPEFCEADWENCPQTRNCGLTAEARKQFWADASFRRRFTRHLGGSNVGYLDGHAAWMPAEGILSNSPTSKDKNAGRLRGIQCLCVGHPESDESLDEEGDFEGEE